jgi:hypothetical protein
MSWLDQHKKNLEAQAKDARTAGGQMADPTTPEKWFGKSPSYDSPIVKPEFNVQPNVQGIDPGSPEKWYGQPGGTLDSATIPNQRKRVGH